MSSLPPRSRSSLPSAPEAEQQVVGAVLLDGRPAYEAAAALVQLEHLGDARLRAIWESCARLYEAGRPIDVVTVMHDLRDSGAGDLVGPPLLAELSSNAVNVGALGEHARIVVEVAQRRQVIIAAEEVKMAADRGDLGKATRKAKEAAAAAAAPGGRTKKKRPAAGRFERGDEVELGHALLQELLAAHGQIVFAEGAWYRYDDERGIWVAWELPELRRRVQDYAGVPLLGGKSLQMSASKISGTLSCARDQVERPTFFHEAAAGVAFSNCFVAAVGREVHVRPHAAEHRARAQLPYAYRQGALCPLWLDTLGGIWRGDDDMQQKADFLGQFIGASMLGIAWKFERNPVLVGSTAANGKSTVLRVLQALFRPEQVVSVAPQDFRHEYHRAKLRGALLNVVSELPDRDLMDTSSYKAIVSGDLIGGRNPGEPVITFKALAGHLFACNELPPVADTSGGPWRRFVPLEFNRSFEASEDKEIGLADRIIATEIAAVAAWAIDCARVLLERGDLVLPPSACTRRAVWRHDSDQVLQWARAELATADDGRLDLVLLEGKPPPKDKRFFPVKSGELYAMYRKWAESVGHSKMSMVKWGARLQGLGAAREHFEDGNRWNVTLRPATLT